MRTVWVIAPCPRALRTSNGAGQLVRIEEEIDPHLEAAAIHRRVYRAGGPALFFARVKGTPFPMVSNLFGTLERMRFLFRDTLDSVRKLVELKTDPGALRRPWRYWNVPFIAWRMRPKFARSGPVLAHTTTLSQLPQLKCWPLDGGPFVTLPAGLHRAPGRTGLAEVEPRHVPRATGGQRVRAGSRVRPALPDPSRDRRPPRGGACARRTACG